MPASILSSKRHPGVFLAAVLTVAVPALALSTAARAEVTAEQQEACTPDALKFCSSTIPDIPKTTACMKAHEAQLTPRCRAAFADATEGGHKTRQTARTGATPAARVERTPRSDSASRSDAAPRPRVASHVERRQRELEEPTPVVRQPYSEPVPTPPVVGALPDSDGPTVTGIPSVAAYRAHIAHLCRDGLIDPFTCRNTMQALSLSE